MSTITVHLDGKLVVDLTLEHLVAQWGTWVAEAQRLSDEYDVEKDKAVAGGVAKGRSYSDANLTWENSRRARRLISAGEWAHRKAQTFALSVLVFRDLTPPR